MLSPSTHQDSPKVPEKGSPVGAGAAPSEARAGAGRGPDTAATPPASVDPASAPWPGIKVRREPECGVLYIDSQPWPDEERSDEIETYIPASALLSDELVEAGAKALAKFDGDRFGVGGRWDYMAADRQLRHREESRACLQAAIEQVGGGQGGR